ncbi:MAG: hypothetical protein H6978_15765 [Gammaproteobacteria bacterium]|nr:hypothetical protein [Gammaproteobacteria bacterium]
MKIQKIINHLAVITTFAAAGSALAAKPGDRLSFISCPIVRDTASVPCWLTEYDGELYYMGIQTDVSAPWQPPYLGHKVLVEATVSDKPRICGGIVLEPINSTVMPELDDSCNTMLPAEDKYQIDFNPRPPGPSSGRLAFDRPPPNAPAEPAELPDHQTFEITFDFDRSISFRHPGVMMRIVNYAQAVNAQTIEVTGRRGATLLSTGETITEGAAIAQRRAEEVASLLRGVGLKANVSMKWSDTPMDADGVEDWKNRSVTVVVSK